jgi:hypothetical protein
MPSQQWPRASCAEILVGPQAARLLGPVDLDEVIAQCGQTYSVSLLEADTGPLNSRSGNPWEPSMRMRQANSSSLAQTVERCAKRASPPMRPEVGPPAQIRGGSKVKAPSKMSM